MLTWDEAAAWYLARMRDPARGFNDLAADVTLEMLPRALPATLGVRFHHNLTDASRSSALLLELGFEVR